jgi:hypothetical protein
VVVLVVVVAVVGVVVVVVVVLVVVVTSIKLNKKEINCGQQTQAHMYVAFENVIRTSQPVFLVKTKKLLFRSNILNIQ